LAEEKKTGVAAVASAIKEICQAVLWLGVIVGLVCVLSSHSCRTRTPQLAREMETSDISVIKFRELEKKVQEVATKAAGAELFQQAGAAPKTIDVSPDLQIKELLLATQELRPDAEAAQGSFWTYLGEYDFSQKRFIKAATFNVTDARPATNRVIIAVTDVYKRNNALRQDAAGQWHLGTVVGVLREGRSVAVQESREIEGENQNRKNIWLRVSPEPLP
jgi:hypothetical protein